MQILFAGEYAAPVGGIERYMVKSARMLRQRAGCRVDCCYSAEGAVDPGFAAAFDRVFGVAELAGQGRYDLVIIHKIRAAGLFAALAAKAGRVALFVHDHEYYCPRRSCYYPGTRRDCHRRYCWPVCTPCALLQRHPRLGSIVFSVPELLRTIRQADQYVVISDFMRGKLLDNGFAAERIVKAAPEIDLAPESVPELEPPHLVLTGQLVNGKGADLLLDALSMVKHDFRLDIVGRGEEEPLLRAHPLASSGKVIFHGYTPEPERFLARAYAAVLPWRWQEPFGLVGPEALAAGVPLVGFQTGGAGEYLIDGETGLAAPPRDVPALAAAIERLLGDPALAKRLGRNGRQLVAEKFSAAAALRSYQPLLESIR